MRLASVALRRCERSVPAANRAGAAVCRARSEGNVMNADWPNLDAQLRELWSEGHSTAEIGRRLGVSKNAVVRRARRIDLPGRPSPIRHDGVVRPRVRRSNRSPDNPRPATPERPTRAADRQPVDRPPPAMPSDPPLSARSTCRWLDGERPTWIYCGAPSRLGSSWCPSHHAIVFVRPEASRGR